jgi:hypothetical protein
VIISRDLPSPFQGTEMPTARWWEALGAYSYYFEAFRLLLLGHLLTAKGQRIPVPDAGEGFEATLTCAWSDLVVANISRLREQPMSYRWQLIRSRLINGF